MSLAFLGHGFQDPKIMQYTMPLVFLVSLETLVIASLFKVFNLLFQTLALFCILFIFKMLLRHLSLLFTVWCLILSMSAIGNIWQASLYHMFISSHLVI